MKETKPFHESCIDSLDLLERTLLEIHGIKVHSDIFIIRFRIGLGLLLGQINRTTIPAKHLVSTIEKIKTFQQGFYERHEETITRATAISDLDEKECMDEYFTETIQNLTERLDTSPEEKK